jgi:protein-S-isoprenylcysteine O-methyltransferase Ste14
MALWIDALELWVGVLGGLTITLAICLVIWGIWLSLRRPHGLKTGTPEKTMNRTFYVIASTLFFSVCIALWRPLPVTLSTSTRILSTILGVLLLFPGTALVIWGRLQLGQMYNVSSGMGVQLYADHRLVTSGPFAIVRHPMYLGILLIALGGSLIYRTWTFVFLLAIIPGIARRAGKEEEALALEFGEQWYEYVKRVPGWIPRLNRRGDDDSETDPSPQLERSSGV